MPPKRSRTELLQGTLDMERKDWIVSSWQRASDRNREFKYYRLTPLGRKQLAHAESKWKQIATAVARMMAPRPSEP